MNGCSFVFRLERENHDSYNLLLLLLLLLFLKKNMELKTRVSTFKKPKNESKSSFIFLRFCFVLFYFCEKAYCEILSSRLVQVITALLY